MNAYEMLHLEDAKTKIEYCLKYEKECNREELYNCINNAINHLCRAATELKPFNKKAVAQ